MKNIVLIFFILSIPALIQAKTTDLEINKWLSKISFTGIRDYVRESEILNESRSTFIIETEGILINGQTADYLFHTYWGNYFSKTHMLRGNLILNWAFDNINKDFKLSLFTIMNTADVFGLDVYHPSISAYVPQVWSNSYLLAGGRVSLSSDFKFAFGAYLRAYPDFITDMYGNFILGEGNENFRPNAAEYNYLFNLELYGYNLIILANTANFYFDSIYLRKQFDFGDNKGVIEFETSYCDYLNTLRLGTQYKKMKITDWLELNGEISMNLYKNGKGPKLSYFSMVQNFNVFKINDKGSGINLKAGESVSYDIFDRFFPGVFAEASFDKIVHVQSFGYISVAFNVSYNYFETMYFCPIVDDFRYRLSAKIAIGE